MCSFVFCLYIDTKKISWPCGGQLDNKKQTILCYVLIDIVLVFQEEGWLLSK